MQDAEVLTSEHYKVIVADDDIAESCLECGRPGCVLLFYEHDAEGNRVSHMLCLHDSRLQEFRDLVERTVAVLDERRK